MAKSKRTIKEAMTLASQSLGSTADRISKALSNILNGRAADEDPCDGSCCTGCNYECSGTCCPNCDGKNRVYCWVRDVFPSSIVYSVSGQMYQRPWSEANGVVTFGEEVPVEIAYNTIGESHRELLTSVENLKEAGGAYNAKTGELTITVIKPGLNTSKSKFYPAAVLKRDMAIFENAKMFLNHQTDKEAKERPEGDVRQWVAQVGKPWAEADGRIRAKAKVIDPAFKEKLGTLQEAGLLHEMGVSIRAIGLGSEAEVTEAANTKPVKTLMIERLIASRSVDFVTYPGAGGQCEVLESERNDGPDLDLVSAAELRERRPDLVELIESNARKAIDTMKTLEQQLQEAQAANATATAENTRLATALAEATSKNAKADAATHLATLLEAAKLPKTAHDRILVQFKEAASTEGMKEAVDAMKTLVESLTPAGAPAKVRGMGSDVNTEVTEAGAPSKVKAEDMKKCFESLGLSEKEAGIAVNGK